jgi:hypothetical protein
MENEEPEKTKRKYGMQLGCIAVLASGSPSTISH